ncbi:hypothetical protein DPMN_035416 [Dreissena polymorpha]|uniref:Uncharacterized protein n=1 Tax=Dreissena polymorpha TaxID=45954 RepID=A0A9D4MBU1_DREPO|nr:hypothetical protein DPMN_035416 [Dreissena polymorpha]
MGRVAQSPSPGYLRRSFDFLAFFPAQSVTNTDSPDINTHSKRHPCGVIRPTRQGYG